MRKELFLKFFLGEVALPFENKTNKIATEIHDCLEYFKDRTTYKKDGGKPQSVHGIGITVGRLTGSQEGYFWEINGLVKRVGKDPITHEELADVVHRIHNITIPYSMHVKTKQKDS